MVNGTLSPVCLDSGAVAADRVATVPHDSSVANAQFAQVSDKC